jgi:uncharacterized protein YjbI with pentapeptide repeats
MTDENPRGDSLGRLRPPLQDAPPQSDLSNSIYEHIDLESKDLHQCLFSQSLLRDSTFRNVDFSNSDFDGARIENCTFQACDLNDCDIRASTLSDVRFIDCNLSSIYMSDNTFNHCTFARTSLRSSTIAGNSLLNCEFEQNDLSRSSVTRCRFETTRFVAMLLGNCTFLYIVMRNCLFFDCSLNVESVGMLYGITLENLKSFHFIYLGKHQEAPEPELVLQAISDEYETRGWHFGLTVIRLNFNTTSALYALRAYFTVFWRQASGGMLPHRDELDFLGVVLHELESETRLPLLACVDLVELVWKVLQLWENESAIEKKHAFAALQRFSVESIMTTNRLIDQLNDQRLQLEHVKTDETIVAKVRFSDPPSFAISEFMTDVAYVSEIGVSRSTHAITQFTGSYIEIVETTLLSLVALQTALFLLNGCLIQLTELKHRVNVMKSDQPPPQYLTRVLSARQEIPPVVQAMLDHLIGYLRNSEILRDPHLKGLSEKNFSDVTVTRRPRKSGPGGKQSGKTPPETPH